MSSPWGPEPLPPILDGSWAAHIENGNTRLGIRLQHRGLNLLILQPAAQVTLVRYHFRMLVFQRGQRAPCLSINLESTNLGDPERQTQVLGANTGWGHMWLREQTVDISRRRFLLLALSALERFLDPEDWWCKKLMNGPRPSAWSPRGGQTG